MTSSPVPERLFLHIGEKNAESRKEKLSRVNRADHSGAAAALGSQPTIILVEDNPADVLLFREALASNAVDPRLYIARDGDEGIRLLDKIDSAGIPCPDLIVLDLNLPRRSGFEVLSRVRSSRRCGETPVVILSSSAAATDRDRAARLGASSYIRKPSTLSEFLSIGARLKEILSGCSG